MLQSSPSAQLFRQPYCKAALTARQRHPVSHGPAAVLLLLTRRGWAPGRCVLAWQRHCRRRAAPGRRGSPAAATGTRRQAGTHAGRQAHKQHTRQQQHTHAVKNNARPYEKNMAPQQTMPSAPDAWLVLERFMEVGTWHSSATCMTMPVGLQLHARSGLSSDLSPLLETRSRVWCWRTTHAPEAHASLDSSACITNPNIHTPSDTHMHAAATPTRHDQYRQ